MPVSSDSPSLADAIRASADRLGISPHDLATAMSYETGGTFNPNLWGGKGGDYLGLIQFGKEERAKYGVKPGQTAVEQMGAVENYLRDRGVRPGMGLLDVYSTINAGRPGLYNRSDAANGGAPGTVADKVASMAGHRMRATALLGGEAPAPTSAASPAASPQVAAMPSAAPAGTPETPESPLIDPALMQALMKIPQGMAQEQAPQLPPIQIDFHEPITTMRARLARAAARRG